MNQQQKAHMPAMGMLQRVTVVQTQCLSPHWCKLQPHQNLEIESKHHNTHQCKILLGGSTFSNQLWRTHGIIGISQIDNKQAKNIWDRGCCCSKVSKPATPHKVSTGHSGGGGNSSWQIRTPGNPTDVKAIAIVTAEIDLPASSTVRGDVVVVIVTADTYWKVIVRGTASTWIYYIKMTCLNLQHDCLCLKYFYQFLYSIVASFYPHTVRIGWEVINCRHIPHFPYGQNMYVTTGPYWNPKYADRSQIHWLPSRHTNSLNDSPRCTNGPECTTSCQMYWQPPNVPMTLMYLDQHLPLARHLTP